MKRLEGKVALVTGGNSGIGLASAKRLQEEGAHVAISGRSRKTLDEALKSIGNGTVAIQADVSKPADLDALYAEVSQKLGKIDVLFVNAGVATFAPIADTSEGTYDQMFGINIRGAYFTIQKALPYLNDGASIILNTSVVSTKGTAGTSAYAATKAALRSLARTAASELVGRGIRVNAVAPGHVKTPMHPAETHEALAKFHPLGRMAQVSDIVEAVLFLEFAEFVTGEILHVDGGQSVGH
jgi:NAD(P)-dependent dehydrogenase (short-subunit alcohol dehydrogenase family)